MAKITLPEFNKIVDVDIPAGMTENDVKQMLLSNPNEYGLKPIEKRQMPFNEAFLSTPSDNPFVRGLQSVLEFEQEHLAPIQRGLASGYSAGLSEPLSAGVKMLAEGKDWKEAKSEVDALPKSFVAELYSAFSPSSLPTKVGAGLARGLKLGQSKNVTGYIPNLIRMLKEGVKGAGVGAGTGAALSGIQQSGDILAGEFSPEEMAFSTAFGGLMGGAAGAAGSGLGRVSDKYGQQAVDALKRSKLAKVLAGIQKKIQGVDAPEPSFTDVSDEATKAMKAFKEGSIAQYDEQAGKFLTEAGAVPQKTMKGITDKLVQSGAVKTVNGKPVVQYDKETGLYNLVKSAKASKVKDLTAKGLSGKEVDELMDAFVSQQQNMSIKDINASKKFWQGVSSYDRPEATPVKKLVAKTLRQDLLTGVKRNYGGEAADEVTKALDKAKGNIELIDSINTVLKVKPGQTVNPQDFYKRMIDGSLKDPYFRNNIKKVFPQETINKIQDGIKSKIINDGLAFRSGAGGVEGQFRPRNFLSLLKKYGFGGNNDALKAILNPTDYQNVKKLEKLSREALRLGMGDVPKTGALYDAQGKLKVSDTATKFFGVDGKPAGSGNLLRDIVEHVKQQIALSPKASRSVSKIADLLQKGSKGIGKGAPILGAETAGEFME